ncbi:hypothetical protein [Hirschia baltica]|nr:hypothetical protein [Hirschia baltica]
MALPANTKLYIASQMCHFITLIIHKNFVSELTEVMKDYRRLISTIDNASVADVLMTGEQQFLLSGKHCDCGTVLSFSQTKISDEDFSKDLTRLKRKGWSQSKLDRWLKDRLKTSNRVSGGSGPDSLSMWKDVVERLLNIEGINNVGILLHFYSGSVDDESFEVARKTFSVSHLEEVLADFPSDSVVTFIRNNPP